MAESHDCLQSGSGGVCAANDIHGHYDDDKIGDNVEAEELHEGGLLIVLEKNKEKKTHKGGLQSPTQISAFDTVELSKLDEQKGEVMKKATAEGVKGLSKSATFPIHASFNDKCLDAVGSGDSKHTKEDAISSLPSETSSSMTRAASLPLKSALRGGSEELGLGPRPKLQVKWDPSVREPRCSTISHAANKNHPKKGVRHGRKGKSTRGDKHKKHNKKEPHKPKGVSGLNLARVHHIDGDEVGKSCNSLPLNCSCEDNEVVASSSMPVISVLGFNVITHTEVNGKYERQGGGSGAVNSSLESITGVVKYPFESTCGGSYFGPKRVSCTLHYGKAM